MYRKLPNPRPVPDDFEPSAISGSGKNMIDDILRNEARSALRFFHVGDLVRIPPEDVRAIAAKASFKPKVVA